MRDIWTIQAGNRRAFLDNNTPRIVAALTDIVGKCESAGWDNVWVGAKVAQDALAAGKADGKTNGYLYNALVDLIGRAKGAGWTYEIYAAAEGLVAQCEKAATGKDNVVVPARKQPEAV